MNEVGRAAVAPELGDIRWAVVDCSDESRLDRLTMRSPAEDDEEGALADAADLRMLGPEIIQNDGIGVGEAVDRIGQWAQLHLAADENSPEDRQQQD